MSSNDLDDLDDSNKLKNIVAFCILMEDIQTKSPDYIIEKFQRYCLKEQSDAWQWGLDSINKEKLEQWEDLWMKQTTKKKGVDAHGRNVRGS
jgi:hypothetical protein